MRRPDDLRAGPDPAAWLIGLALLLAFAPTGLALLGLVAGHVLLRWTRARPWMLAAGGAGLLLLVVLLAGGPALALVGHFAGLAALVHAPHSPTAAEALALAAEQAPLGLALGLTLAGLTELGRVGHELDPAHRARTERDHSRRRARAVRLAERPRPTAGQAPPLAAWIGGDLDDWRRGREVVMPASVRALPRVVLGQSGFGKTTLLERETLIAGHLGEARQVFDGKGTDGDLAGRLVAAYLAANPTARIGLYPEVPMDGWRGGPQAVLNRLLACIDYTGMAEFHGDRLALVLRLALFAPGEPAVSSSAELLARLQPAWLTQRWQGQPAEAAEVSELFRGGDPTLRLRALLAAVGRTLDGSWSFEDVDLAVVTAPSLEQPKDASAVMRLLLVDYAHYAAVRKAPDGQAALAFDEFSALEAGHLAAIQLLERVRSSGVSVTLCAQSAEGLGPEREAARILAACSGGYTLFRLADPERLAALAGTSRQPELTHQLGPGGPAGRAMARMADVARVDANQVRALAAGEAILIEGGRAAHVQVVRNGHDDQAAAEAAAIVRQARTAGPGAGPFASSWAAYRSPTVPGAPAALAGPSRAVLAGRQRPTAEGRRPDGFLVVRPSNGAKR
jgi:hypothetical protein